MELSDEQIKNGFWGWNPDKKWPPKSTTYFEEYKPSERLNLVITQLRESPYKQNKSVESWCEHLPNLKEVKYLWFHSRVNQAMFDAACNMPNLEGLYVKWSGIKSIDYLISLKKLKHLHLGSSAQIENIKIIGEMNSLVTLEMENIKKISDFKTVSELNNLEGLGIDGSMWKAQKIDTLKPLEKLVNLKYLTLVNTRIKDRSFDPLLHLTNLVRFHCSWNYPEAEFEKLKQLPNLKYGNIETSWKEIREIMKN
jgi:Leucine-rich repeat (LRR) protein